MRLDGKVALVTGAGSGIGKAIAYALFLEGASVAVTDCDSSSAERTASQILATGGKAGSFQLDVSDPDNVQHVVHEVADRFKQIDILVNNAGITRDNLLIKMSDMEWDRVLRVNLDSVFYCTRAVTRGMMARRSGRIVNIASVAGEIGNFSQANYSASKGGVIALTKTTARELARYGITVNAVAPGSIETAMTEQLSDSKKAEMIAQIPLRCFGKPEDVADAVVYLCSQAGYITGQVINVDGGMVM